MAEDGDGKYWSWDRRMDWLDGLDGFGKGILAIKGIDKVQ